MRVSIRKCGGFDKWSYKPRTDNEAEAIDRTVKHFWGQRAFFERDNGLRDCGTYGQIYQMLTGTRNHIFSASSLTGHISIETD